MMKSPGEVREDLMVDPDPCLNPGPPLQKYCFSAIFQTNNDVNILLAQGSATFNT